MELKTKRLIALSGVLALAVVFLVGGEVSNDPAYPYSSIAELVHDNRDGTCDCGSGTLIAVSGDKALILTAAHVAGGKGNTFKVKWRKAGQESNGVCIDILHHTDFETDAALVLCDRPEGLTPVPMAPYDKAYGPWTNAGYGYGESKENGNGRLWVSYTTESEYKDGVIYGNGLFVGGMSGGACIDSRGYLVGITNGSTDVYQFSMATSGPLVREMVAKHIGGL